MKATFIPLKLLLVNIGCPIGVNKACAPMAE